MGRLIQVLVSIHVTQVLSDLTFLPPYLHQVESIPYLTPYQRYSIGSPNGSKCHMSDYSSCVQTNNATGLIVKGPNLKLAFGGFHLCTVLTYIHPHLRSSKFMAVSLETRT